MVGGTRRFVSSHLLCAYYYHTIVVMAITLQSLETSDGVSHTGTVAVAADATALFYNM